MADHPDESERERSLTPEQYRVTQEAGTEPAFTGRYWDEKRPGIYRCVVCDEPLFSSEAKYDSGSGWPSFTTPLDLGGIEEHTDESLGVTRVEGRCANCGAHLGHIFPDGPGPGGLRYCINSAALELERGEEEDEN